MLKKLRMLFAGTLLLAGLSGAHAAVLTFDMPAPIDIDNNTLQATYPEAGFILSGQAASYLPLDGIGSAGTGGLLLFADSPLVLSAAGGGEFRLLGLSAGLFDPGDVGTLAIQGLRSDNTVLDKQLSLAALQAVSFQDWQGLLQVSLTANVGVVFDDVNVERLPEPSTAVLGLAAAGGLLLSRRRRQGRPA